MQEAVLIYSHPNGDLEYHIHDGRRVRLKREDLQFHSVAELLRAAGLVQSNRRVPVIVQSSHGGPDRQVGTLPADFDWRNPGVRNFLVDIRPGDFTWDAENDRWIASWTLHLGDFEAIPAFRRS